MTIQDSTFPLQLVHCQNENPTCFTTPPPHIMEVIMLFEFCSKWLFLKLNRFYSSQTLIEVTSALCISSKFLLYFLPLRHIEVCWLLSLVSGREEWKGNHFRKQPFVFYNIIMWKSNTGYIREQRPLSFHILTQKNHSPVTYPQCFKGHIWKTY